MVGRRGGVIQQRLRGLAYQRQAECGAHVGTSVVYFCCSALLLFCFSVSCCFSKLLVRCFAVLLFAYLLFLYHCLPILLTNQTTHRAIRWDACAKSKCTNLAQRLYFLFLNLTAKCPYLQNETYYRVRQVSLLSSKTFDSLRKYVS